MERALQVVGLEELQGGAGGAHSCGVVGVVGVG